LSLVVSGVEVQEVTDGSGSLDNPCLDRKLGELSFERASKLGVSELLEVDLLPDICFNEAGKLCLVLHDNPGGPAAIPAPVSQTSAETVAVEKNNLDLQPSGPEPEDMMLLER
jgi:hypothetical protein